MDIIIDGYNLIGSDQGMRGALEQKRDWLIHRLSLYKTMKEFGLVVVFDGWRSGLAHEVEEKRDGINVVYSRQGEKADSVIVRMARQRGSGCVVVTSDREVRTAVEKFGAVAIYAGEFAAILRRLDMPFADADYDETDAAPRRGGNPNQLSKAERRRREKLKKLWP